MSVKITHRCFRCNKDVTETRTDTIAALIEEGFPFMCLDCNDRWRKGQIAVVPELLQGELFADITPDNIRRRKRRRSKTPTKPA
jgi:hypothetical protein